MAESKAGFASLARQSLHRLTRLLMAGAKPGWGARAALCRREVTRALTGSLQARSIRTGMIPADRQGRIVRQVV
ncbi:MAG: hypothetical protein OXH79_06380 [Boseongicola sp.]|nr:hypothetical protein [Boseongicola sp.]